MYDLFIGIFIANCFIESNIKYKLCQTIKTSAEFHRERMSMSDVFVSIERPNHTRDNTENFTAIFVYKDFEMHQ